MRHRRGVSVSDGWSHCGSDSDSGFGFGSAFIWLMVGHFCMLKRERESFVFSVQCDLPVRQQANLRTKRGICCWPCQSLALWHCACGTLIKFLCPSTLHTHRRLNQSALNCNHELKALKSIELISGLDRAGQFSFFSGLFYFLSSYLLDFFSGIKCSDYIHVERILPDF